MGKIAVDPSLTPIKDYLASQGYTVESVNPGAQPVNMNGYDAFVVSGLSSNFFGVENTQTKAAVINASGMTPEDVLNALKKQFQYSATGLY